MKTRFPRIINNISKFTTFKNRLKRMKTLLDLDSERAAAKLVEHRAHWFDPSFVKYCQSLR